MIDHDALTPFIARYAALDYEPLRITARLAEPLVMYDPVNLDNVLGAAVVKAAMGANWLPPSAEPYFIPLPVRCLWRCPETDLPLWATTVFEPVGIAHPVTSYTHRRTLRTDFVPDVPYKGTLRPFNPNPKLGRFKETRTPHPAKLAEAWRADVWGHRASIEELLARIAFLGKRRAEGRGFVVSWQVEQIETFSLIDDQGRLRRPVPTAAREELGIDDGGSDSIRVMSWTLPYWSGVPKCRALCVPDGVLVHNGVEGTCT